MLRYRLWAFDTSCAARPPTHWRQRSLAIGYALLTMAEFSWSPGGVRVVVARSGSRLLRGASDPYRTLSGRDSSRPAAFWSMRRIGFGSRCR